MEYIVYEQKGSYAVITISREKALNALNSQVLDELKDVYKRQLWYNVSREGFDDASNHNKIEKC